MKVRDLMSADVARLERGATVRQAIDLMAARRISSLLVDRQEPGTPFGIVTPADVVYKVAARGRDPSATPVADIMSPALLSVDAGLDVGYASRLMRRFGVRHLPVFEGSRLVGVLSYHDVLRCFSLFSTVPFFRQLCVEDLLALLQLSAVRCCRRGEILMEEGEEGHDLYVVEEGEMTVTTRQAGRIARIHPGEVFGEMELFGGRRSASVKAAVDSRLLVLDGRRFLDLLAGRERLACIVFKSLSQLLSERLRHANRFLFLRGIWAHRRTMARTAAAAAAVFGLLVLGTAAVSEKPALCRSCHYMRPYQASWSVSPHKNVSCTACHTTYGFQGAVRGKITGVAMVVRYATGTYDPRPEARVEDRACLRSGCHESLKLDRSGQPKNAGPPGETGPPRFETAGFSGSTGRRFNHSRHLGPLPGFGPLHCTSCHNHRGQEQHFSTEATTCFLCHFPAAGNAPTPCLGCHDLARNGGGIQAVRVDHAGLSASTNCLACHRNIAVGTGHVEDSRCTQCHLKPGLLSPEEMHREHVARAGVDCLACHSSVEHPGKGGQILAGECTSCHGEPHAAQERLYLGQGGTDVLERPALMFYRHVECTGCHASRPYQTCRSCHDSDVERQARTWKLEIERSAEEVGRSLARFEERANSDFVIRNPQAVRFYDQARRNYDIVSQDPSAGVHNFRYAQDVLSAARRQIEAALTAIDSQPGDRQ